MTDTEPVGRLYELRQEVDVPEPYVLTENITLQPITQGMMRRIATAKTDAEVDDILLGDQAEAVHKVFENDHPKVWMKFMSDYRKHMFGPGADDVEGKSPA